MSTPRAAEQQHRSQQRLKVATLAASRRLWARMGDDFDASWERVAPQMTLLASAAQVRAAQGAAGYVPRVLDELDLPDEPAGRVRPQAFAGAAPDGRSLDGLLYGAVTQAKHAVGKGAETTQALAQGGRWLDMTLSTLVADATRQATQVAITARPQITGYVRMVNPPCCPMCAILAGRWYRYSDGFARHPGCDCIHVPATEDVAGDLRTNPEALLEAGEVRGMTRAERQAVDDGADFAAVVNARRSRYVTSVGGQRVIATRESVTRRGVYGRSGARAGLRITPEQIYRVASDRADAIRLLRRFGYIR